MMVTVTASDNVSVMKVDLLIDGVTVQTAPTATATFTVMLADGEHTLQADAFDTAGQRGESALVHVTVGGDPTTKPKQAGEVRGVCSCGSAEGSLIAAALLVLIVRRRPIAQRR